MPLSRSPLETPMQAVELRNSRGDCAVVLTQGASLASLHIHTEAHGAINTVLGYQDYEQYLNNTAYLGATAGRYCNRIANSRFQLGDTTHELTANEGPHQLHGGPEGFSTLNWNIRQQTQRGVTLALTSADQDQGYPGNLEVELSYSLSDTRCLEIQWDALSDCDTVVSITNHSYFNLAGAGNIRNHYLRIPIDYFTPITDELIPSGEICSVAGTVFDLRDYTELSAVLDCGSPLLAATGGLDHNWARGQASEMLPCAQLLCRESGLLLEASTTLPGLHCYTGNHLSATGSHEDYAGICLEAQYYPNSPNENAFPSPLLKAGQRMSHRICYQLSEVDPSVELQARV